MREQDQRQGRPKGRPQVEQRSKFAIGASERILRRFDWRRRRPGPIDR